MNVKFLKMTVVAGAAAVFSACSAVGPSGGGEQWTEEAAPSGAVTLANAHGRAVVSLIGANVMSYVPAGGPDVFFRVPGFCTESKAFPHGGMPIAWPWFGRKNGTEVEEDLHGFVRMLPWKVVSRSDSKVVLRLASDAQTRTLYDRDFRMTCTVALGERLSVSLLYENTDARAMMFRTGFHPFFRVSDNARLSVRGLEGIVDVPVGSDTVHRQLARDIELIDVGMGRKIVIGSTGGDLVNVWNDYSQWPKIYAHGGAREFCCVEPIVLGPGKKGAVLPPGASCRLTIDVGVEPLGK